MKVKTTMEREEVSVHTMNSFHRGPVFYASLPCNPRDTAHRRLVTTLWNHLSAMESPLWKRCESSNRAASPIQVIRGPLGRPHFLLGEYEGPAISFSECGGNVWAALCGDESDIGIDVAVAEEFRGDYPFHRVFHTQELQHVLSLEGGDLENAAALLWSVKEAVVKALGCAFHLVDPLQITINPSEEKEAKGSAGYTFQVGLSEKALMRFPAAAHGSLWVRSLPQNKMWLSIALLNRRPTGHD